MSLFSLFHKKDELPKIKDLVWISQESKLNGVLTILKEYPKAVIFAWFHETKNTFEEFLKLHGENIEIKIAGRQNIIGSDEQTIIFLEHYPLHYTESELIQNWQVKNVLVLNALDEPLFRSFGSDRIIQMMKAMGLKEEEFIEHTFITKSIENAQHKIEKKVVSECPANSSKDWFSKNIGI